MNMNRLHIFVLTAIIVVPRSVATAQDIPPKGPPAEITVAVTDQFPYPDARAVVIRRAGPGATDVILLSQGRADAAQLAAAFVVLAVARDVMGEVSEDQVIRVQERRPPADIPDRLYMDAHRALAMMRGASPKVIPGIGNVLRATRMPWRVQEPRHP